MANKKFVTKNGALTNNLQFVDVIGSSTQSITLSLDSLGTLSFDGINGQLFSVTDNMSGTIFSVNDISGIPSIEVLDDGTTRLAEFSGNVLIGTNTDDGANKLQVLGNTSLAGEFTVTDTGTTAITGTLSFKNNDNDYSALQVFTSGGGLSLNSHVTGHGYVTATNALNAASYNATNGSAMWLGNGSRFKLTNSAGTETYIFIDTAGLIGIGTATPTQKLDVVGNIAVSGTVDGRDIASDGAKLDGIESGATADQTGAEIKTLYEAELDTNAFTDALLGKLNGIETGATADQTKLDIDALGIDAATLDGIDSTGFSLASHNHDTTYVSKTSNQALHATDALSITGNTLYLNKADGTNETIDLSIYLDDTNLSRITSGVYNAPTQELIFTRDDLSTFAIDASMFFDDTNLVTSVDTLTGAVDLSTRYLGISAKAADSGLLDGLDSTQFLRSDANDSTSGSITLTGTGRNGLINSQSYMAPLAGFVAYPKGYTGGAGFEFRGDTSQTAYLFDEQNPTYTMLAGTDPGATNIHTLFEWTNNYINLNTYKDVSNNWGFEITGFSLSNSSNTSWKPHVFFHSSGTAVTNIKIEGRAGDNLTWVTMYDGPSLDFIVPNSYTVISPGVLTGLRYSFTGITANSYLKMLGVTSLTSSSYSWNMMKNGGNFFGDIGGKSLGLETWKITQAGVATGLSSVAAASIIEDGVALSSKYLGISAKAADSDKLDGLDSTQFLRSDTSDTISGTLTIDSAVTSALLINNSSNSVAQIYSNNSYLTINSAAYIQALKPIINSPGLWFNNGGVIRSMEADASWVDLLKLDVDNTMKIGTLGGVSTGGDLAILTNGVERARFDTSGNLTITGTVDGRDIAVDGVKLDGIESGATADQTGAEIKSLYEAEADTNAFTDTLLGKLNGIEAGATADQTKADIDALGINAATLDGYDSSNLTTGHVFANEGVYPVTVGMAESWFKITDLSGGIFVTYFEILSNYDNCASREHVVITTAGYNFNHHISSTTSFYNQSKLLEIKTNNADSGNTVEIWARFALCDTSNGSITIRSTRAIPTLVPATPAFGGNGIASLVFGNTNRNDSSLLITRGIKIDGNKVHHDANFGKTEIDALGIDAATASSATNAANADKLDNLDSTQFLRSDVSDTMSGTLTMNGLIQFNTSSTNNGFVWNVNSDSAGINFKNTGDGDANSYFNFFTKDNGNEYMKFSHQHYLNGNTDFMDIKDSVIRVNGEIYANAAQSGDYTLGTNALTGGNLVYHAGNLSKAVIDALGVDASTVNGLTVETAVPVGALFTDTTYVEATATTGGLLTDVQAIKLNGIEANATADQTGAEIKALYEAELDTNAFTDTFLNKLNGIEANATADQTKADIDALGIDAATLDGIDSTEFVNVSSTQSINGNKTFSGNTLLSNSLTYTEDGKIRIIQPKGGIYASNVIDEIGYIKIQLPVSWNAAMFTMTVDIFDYKADSTFTMKLGGYLYVTGANWVNTTAVVMAQNESRFYNVHFGHDGTYCAVYIGDATSDWDYLKVNVREVFVGHGGSAATDWDDGWDVLVTPTLGTITSTRQASFVASRAVVSDEATTLTGLIPTITELNYVDGVTSSIQTQINSKFNTSGGKFTGDIELVKSGNGVVVDWTAGGKDSVFTMKGYPLYGLFWEEGANDKFTISTGNNAGNYALEISDLGLVHKGNSVYHAGNSNLTSVNWSANNVTAAGTITSTGDVVVGGNLTVNGTTSTVNSTTVNVADKNITIGNVTTPTDITADGGGLTLKGATDKTITWISAKSAWESNQLISIKTASPSIALEDTSLANSFGAMSLGAGDLNIWAPDLGGAGNVVFKGYGNVNLTGDLLVYKNSTMNTVYHSGNFGKTEIDTLGINAATIDGLDSTQFLRSDQADSFTGQLTMVNGDIQFATGLTGFTNPNGNDLLRTSTSDGGNASVIGNTFGTTYFDSLTNPVVRVSGQPAEIIYHTGNLTKTVVDGLGINAQTLDSLDSTQFLRSDISDTMNGNLTINGSVSIDDNINIDSGTGSTSAITTTTITTFDGTIYNTGKFIIQIKDTITGSYQTSELLVVHDGTTATSTEYGVVYTNTLLAVFNVNYNAGTIEIQATATSANAMNYTVSKNLIKG